MTLSWLASSPEKVLSNWCVPRFWNMILGTGEEQEALLRWILPLCAGSLPIPLMRSYPYPEQHQHTESGNPCMSLPVRGSMYAQARFGRCRLALALSPRGCNDISQQRYQLVGRCDVMAQDRLEGTVGKRLPARLVVPR